MSLWHKPIDSITFQDIDEFCALQLEESGRLDYKGDFPDLAKTMAAMANSVGGMIILGIDADTKTNKPIWPPQLPVAPKRCLPYKPGHAEKVYQLARDAIYPPIMPEVSAQIRNVKLPGYAVVVIRIPESKDAPHAIDGKKGVYIYQRTGNQNDPHVRAEIDYIESLLRRRERIEEDREQIIRKAIQRGLVTTGRTDLPHRWVSILPYYPWRNLATPEACYEFHRRRWNQEAIASNTLQFIPQSAPGGTHSVAYDRTADQRRIAVACANLSTRGHVFCYNMILEYAHDPQYAGQFSYRYTERMLVSAIETAQQFYAFVGVDASMYFQLALGIEYATNLRIEDVGPRGVPRFHFTPFPDPHFRAERALNGIQGVPKDLAAPLLRQLCFEFGVERIEP